jgi:hypothetical protein
VNVLDNGVLEPSVEESMAWWETLRQKRADFDPGTGAMGSYRHVQDVSSF